MKGHISRGAVPLMFHAYQNNDSDIGALVGRRNSAFSG
jgi:hypothetical protein